MALRERVLQCSLCGFEKKRAQDVFWQWEEELWNSTEQHHSEQNSCFVIEIMVPQYITAIATIHACHSNHQKGGKILTQ